MKKQIIITIQEPKLITNPPQPEAMDIQINGMMGVEAIHYLLSCASQIAAKEIPPIVRAIHRGQEEINPMGQKPGEA